MKIDNGEVLELDESGVFESTKGGITQEGLKFALKAVSKNLYQDSYGSIVRELVSNAQDAVVASGNEVSPILVLFTLQDSGQYVLQIKDQGIGISPDQMKSIYMNWFESNKRDTNSLIGGWG